MHTDDIGGLADLLSDSPQILLSVLKTVELVLFLCKLRLSSFLFGVSVRQKNHWGLFQPDANISTELVKGFRFCHCA